MRARGPRVREKDAMETEAMTCGKRDHLLREIRHLREALDEAWWREAPLEQIMDLERRLNSCRKQLGDSAKAVEH